MGGGGKGEGGVTNSREGEGEGEGRMGNRGACREVAVVRLNNARVELIIIA